MASDQGVETQKMALTTSTSEATFSGGINACYLSADADIYVDFDQPTDTGSFLVKANIAYPKFEFEGSNVKKIYARSVTGSAN